MLTEIILASESKNRRTLMDLLKIPYKVIPSNFDEESITNADLKERVKGIALGKAASVAVSHQGLIIAADTFNIFNNKAYQKPSDLDHARAMLRAISGKTGYSLTGVCMINTRLKSRVLETRTIRVACKELSNEQIEDYINACPVTSWACAYNPVDSYSATIFQPVDRYRYGMEYGLPLDVLAQGFKQIGLSLDLSRFR